jgi:hypothetical protein
MKATQTAPQTETNQTYKIPAKLLSKGSTNAKTTKNDRETHILYLAPVDQNSKKKNLCPFASKGCAEACLYSAGRGAFTNVKTARMNKTEYFVQDPKTFTAQLILEIEFLRIRAKREGKQIAVRLNGTADIDFLFLFKKYHNWDYEEKAERPGDKVSGIYFYDYTPNKAKYFRYQWTKYALIFSRKEDNEEEVKEVLNRNGKVSAVFLETTKKPNYKGYPIYDGDERDDKIIDLANVSTGLILSLKAKGKAKKDTTGFVIRGY